MLPNPPSSGPTPSTTTTVPTPNPPRATPPSNPPRAPTPIPTTTTTTAAAAAAYRPRGPVPQTLIGQQDHRRPLHPSQRGPLFPSQSPSPTPTTYPNPRVPSPYPPPRSFPGFQGTVNFPSSGGGGGGGGGLLPRGFGYGDSGQVVRVVPHQQHQNGLGMMSGFPRAVSGGPVPRGGGGGVRGVQQYTIQHTLHMKVAPSQGSGPDSRGRKDPNDSGRDDHYVMIRDRKVKISNGTSMYALCRSWFRNGYVEETQPKFAEAVRSLPKPLPLQVSDANSVDGQADEEEEKAEDEKSVENMSSEELLQIHVKRAKRVRARLNEKRLQRISRYKNRLALLLPPLMEQTRNDANGGS